MNDEQLESLLRQAGESETPPREPSLRLTANVLSTVARRQTRRRRAWMLSTVAGAYVAGLLTMWFAFPSRNDEQTAPTARQIASQADVESLREAPRLSDTPVSEVHRPPHDEERVSADIVAVEKPRLEKSVYQLFRELGDASHARGDVTSSVRYYRLALDSATPQELLTGSNSDNLLLLSLKQDRIASIQLTTHGESL